MADGGYGPDFLSRSMFFREAEAGPTQQELSTMTAPFGGSPEQARAFLQSPGAQQLLQHFGLGGFDPNQIRQSPFLPNSFMQHHPHMGGAMSNAMANAAATPEAPMVSGAGSGISRAMQGMYGGPELQRQYQVRQLMAPFQAMGMQMPGMAEQRRQELLQALEADMKHRQGVEDQTRPDQMDARRMTAEAAEIRARAQQEKADEPRFQFGPIGTGYATTQHHDAQPAGGGPGMAYMQQQTGEGRTNIDPTTGQPFHVPGWGLTPETQAGWNTSVQPYDQGAMQGQFGAKAEGSQTPEKAALLGSQTDLNKARVPTEKSKQGELDARASRERNEANQPGGRYGARDRERWAKDYNDTEQRVTTEINKIDQLVAAKALKPEEGEQQKARWTQFLATAKENFDRQMGKSGQSSREAGTVSPGAKTAPPKTGGAQNVSPAGASGLPSGYEFNDQGIPVKIQQAPATTQAPPQ